jgi:hypothetical protein
MYSATLHNLSHVQGKLLFFFFIFFIIVVLGGDTLQHLQRFLHHI